MSLTGSSLRPVLVILVLLFPSWGCSDSATPAASNLRPTLFSAFAVQDRVSSESEEVSEPSYAKAAIDRHMSKSAITSEDADERSPATYGMSPDACERFLVRVDERGHRQHRRIRKPWTRADQERFRGLVDLVATELGADPRLFRAWSLRESTYRPSAIHVLNPDVEGATAAWRRYDFAPEEERMLVGDLERLDARAPEYWRKKAALRRLQTFRDNAYFRDVIEYDLELPNGATSRDVSSIWAFGYGPFGFNPTYYLPLWDANSPPWVFCGDDGLVSIVTAIWAAREHQQECSQLGVGDSYIVVNRRFGSGHCVQGRMDDLFRERLEKLEVDPDARARLGSKWPRATTKREDLLQHLRTRARDKGLLPSTDVAAPD